MPDVPALKIYDVLMADEGTYPSDVLRIMEALGSKCDQEGDGVVVREC